MCIGIKYDHYYMVIAVCLYCGGFMCDIVVDQVLEYKWRYCMPTMDMHVTEHCAYTEHTMIIRL